MSQKLKMEQEEVKLFKSLVMPSGCFPLSFAVPVGTWWDPAGCLRVPGIGLVF